MGSLSSSDREKIKLSLPKQFNKLIDVCIAKLYIAYPSPTEWTYTGLYGALCLTDDLVGNTFFLKLVDVSGLNKGVIWDQELYVNFEYIQDRTFFHTFEMEDCLAGLLFEDVHEAQHFYKRVTKRQKYGSKNTINNKNAIKLEKEIDVENKAAIIHGPRGEELISNQRSRYDYSSRIVENVGYRSTDSYETSSAPDVAPANDDVYNSFISDQSASHKQPPPPPPPPPPQLSSSESSNEQTAYTDSSRFATSEDEPAKQQTPVHRLPPPPEHYATSPPPIVPHQAGNAVPPPFIHTNPPGQASSQRGGYGQPPQSASYGQPPQSTPYGQSPQSTSYGQPPQSTPYGQPPQSSSYGQPPQSASFGLPSQNGHSQLPLPPNRQQPIVPQRTSAPPPPPSRRSGPPPPPRNLANQATGHRPLQSLRTQKTGGRGLPPPPPLRRSATGAAPPPPPPARRMGGQSTGAATTAGFAVSNIPATTFGAPTVSHASQPPLANRNISPANGYQQPSQNYNIPHQQQAGNYRPQNSAPQAQSQQDYVRPHQIPPQSAQHGYISSPPHQMHSNISQPPALPQHQQQPTASGIPPPQPMAQQTSIPPPPPMMQQSGIPTPPPMPQQTGVPPPPPMPQQTGVPPPPPMPQQTSVPQSQAPGGDSRDALLSSIRLSGIGSLRKTDTSEINDRSAVQVAAGSEASIAPSTSQPMGAQTTGGGALADALAAALNSRKKKVSSYADDDDGDW